MTRKQKIDLLRCTKQSFRTRLSSLKASISSQDRLSEKLKTRLRDLEQCVRFCEYLEMVLIHGQDFEKENVRMLDYIGLPELYEQEICEL